MPRQLFWMINLLLTMLVIISVTYWSLEFLQPKTYTLQFSESNESTSTMTSKPIDWQKAKYLFYSQAPAQATLTTANLQLRGVILAPQEENSLAILWKPNAPSYIVGIGEKIDDNTTLQSIQRDHVLLTQYGAIQRVNFPLSSEVEKTPFAKTSASLAPRYPFQSSNSSLSQRAR